MAWAPEGVTADTLRFNPSGTAVAALRETSMTSSRAKAPGVVNEKASNFHATVRRDKVFCVSMSNATIVHKIRICTKGVCVAMGYAEDSCTARCGFKTIVKGGLEIGLEDIASAKVNSDLIVMHKLTARPRTSQRGFGWLLTLRKALVRSRFDLNGSA